MVMVYFQPAGVRAAAAGASPAGLRRAARAAALGVPAGAGSYQEQP